MRKSEIKLTVTLDEQEVPEMLEWSASEKGGAAAEQTNAFALFVWNDATGDIMPVNLWTGHMDKIELKKFYINIIGSLAERLAFATEDYDMANDMEGLCRKMAERLMQEIKEANALEGNAG